MAAANAAAINTTRASTKKKNKSITVEEPDQNWDPEQDSEFDNPLATPDSDTRQKDFTAAGGELAEYGEGYDEKFSSSQIFQKLETEASVSLSPHPLCAARCTSDPSQDQPSRRGNRGRRGHCSDHGGPSSSRCRRRRRRRCRR
jgi:hypothetical protein